MTDTYEPILHVFDAETKKAILAIPLRGVEKHDPAAWAKSAFLKNEGYPYSDMRSCSGGVACTPDGSLVLVTSSAGLQVVDARTNQVVRTLPDVLGGAIAVSCDGERAYVACDTFAGIAVKPEGSEVFFSETYKKRVQVVDALTLEDRWNVSTEPSYAIGIGLVPSGAKAYVVRSADNGYSDAFSGGQTVPSTPKAEDYFCGVIIRPSSR